MAVQKNERGFYQDEPIEDTRGGIARVAQSSAAVCEGDDVQSGYIWLFVTDRVHNRSGTVDAALHLSHEQAIELSTRLVAMVNMCSKEHG